MQPIDFNQLIEMTGKELATAIANSKTDKKNLELEVRLGIFDMKNKRFSSNIGAENYNLINGVLDKANWSMVEKTETHDKFFKGAKSSESKRVSTVKTNGAEDQVIGITKTKIFQKTFRVENLPLDMRVTLSSETKMTKSSLKKFESAAPEYERAKSRTSRFSDNASYDITKVKSGDEITFEFEVEHTAAINNPTADLFGIFHKAISSNFIVDGLVMGDNHQIPIETVSFSVM